MFIHIFFFYIIYILYMQYTSIVANNFHKFAIYTTNLQLLKIHTQLMYKCIYINIYIIYLRIFRT